MKALQKHFTTFVLCLLLTALPLYVDDSYFNIIEAKTSCFYLIFLIALVPAAVLWCYRRKKGELEPMPLDITDLGITAFAAVSLFSCLISGRVYDSFTGADGWYVGAALFCALALLYFFFSRNHSYDHNLWLVVYAVYIIVFIIALLQFAGYDIFGFYDRLTLPQHFQYISTYGNSNWFAGCLCMLIPIAFVFFLSSKSRSSYIINLIFLAFALSNLLICISDGAYLGLGFCAFFVLPYAFGSMTRLRRTLLVGLIFSSEAYVIQRLNCFNTALNRATGISKTVFDSRICFLLTAFFACALVICCLLKKENKKLLRAACIIVEAALAVGVILILRDAIVGFTDTWGSSRGFIWRVSLEHYSDLSIGQKLFGIGPDLLRNVYSEVELKFQGLAVLSSHSEPIQILLTTGITGLAAYITIICGVVISFIKQRENIYTHNIRKYALFTALSAYLGQSFVNSATTVNLCLLYIILSLYRSASARELQTEGVS